MVRCGLGMQQYAMHNATIQKTTLFFEFGVFFAYLCNFDQLSLYILSYNEHWEFFYMRIFKK